MKRILIILLFCGLFIKVFGQISTEEMPVSFRPDVASRQAVSPADLRTMPLLDMNRITQEDLQEENNGVPPYSIRNEGPLIFCA